MARSSLLLAIFALTITVILTEKPKCYHYSEEKLIVFNNTWPLQMTFSLNSQNIYIVNIDLLKWGKVLSVIKNGTTSLEEIFVKNAVVNTVAADYSPNSYQVYIGCDSGLKVYEELSDIVRDIPGITQHISYLFLPTYRKDIFAIIWPEYNVYRFKYLDDKGENVHFPALREASGRFVLDFDDNFFYQHKKDTTSSEYTTYVRLAGDAEAGEPMYYDLHFDVLAVDRVGRVFGTIKNSVYGLLSDYRTAQLVTTVDSQISSMCFGEFNRMVIGGNNIFTWAYNYLCYSETKTSQDASKCYEKHVLDYDISMPTQLVVSYKTGDLYIINKAVAGKLFKIANGTSVTKEHHLLLGDVTANTLAVDHVVGKLYIGTDNGLEIYDEMSGKRRIVPSFKGRVREIFVQSATSDIYVQSEASEIYKYESLDRGFLEMKREKLSSAEPSTRFVVDEAYNYFFQHATATQVRLVGNSRGPKLNHQLKLVVDNKGIVYGTANNSLYLVDLEDVTPHFIAKLGFAFLCMSFDINNNMLFATPNHIIRYTLLPRDDQC